MYKEDLLQLSPVPDGELSLLIHACMHKVPSSRPTFLECRNRIEAKIAAIDMHERTAANRAEFV